MKKIIIIITLFLGICSGYIVKVETHEDRMSPGLLLTVIDKLERGENIIFTKFGDGEYNCMVGERGANCDGDRYHPWLANRLWHSLLNLSVKKNTYLGRWWTENVWAYFDAFASKKGVKIPWYSYHLFMNDDEFFKYDYMYKFVQFIVNTNRKKIFVANINNKGLKDFFRANTYITIPSQNWSYEYGKWLKIIEMEVEENAILLISAGMCSKVLIDEITDRHNLTCIDLGSSFDLLATGQKSRSWKHSYEDELKYYKNFIPKN